MLPRPRERLDRFRRRFGRRLRARWAVIVAGVLIGAGIAAGLAVTADRAYRAEIQVFVVTSHRGGAYSAASFTPAQVRALTELAVSPAVLDGVRRRLTRTPGVRVSAGQLDAAAGAGQSTLTLRATDTSATRAVRLADAAAAAFVQAAQHRAGATSGPGQSPSMRFYVPDPAGPAAREAGGHAVTVSLGLLLGLLGGIAGAGGWPERRRPANVRRPGHHRDVPDSRSADKHR